MPKLTLRHHCALVLSLPLVGAQSPGRLGHVIIGTWSMREMRKSSVRGLQKHFLTEEGSAQGSHNSKFE